MPDELRINTGQLRNIKMDLDTIEDFKQIVQDAIEGEGTSRKFEYWISEKYEDNSNDEKKSFIATIMCQMETLRDDIPGFKGNSYSKIWGVKVYEIFYYRDLTYADGGFVVNTTDLDYDMIKVLQKLEEVKPTKVE